jgi:hypothetical protein
VWGQKARDQEQRIHSPVTNASPKFLGYIIMLLKHVRCVWCKQRVA